MPILIKKEKSPRFRSLSPVEDGLEQTLNANEEKSEEAAEQPRWKFGWWMVPLLGVLLSRLGDCPVLPLAG